jgi:hypothetical protein
MRRGICSLEKKERDKGDQPELNEIFAKVYSVELLFEKEPVFPIDQIIADLKNQSGTVDVIDDESVTSFFFPEFKQYKDDKLPAQCVLTKKYLFTNSEKYFSSVEQTWDFEEVHEILKKVKYCCIFSDIFSTRLHHIKRIELFNKVLSAVLVHTNCVAINWSHSQRLVDPRSFIRQIQGGDYLHGALNVRFYNVEGTDEEVIMDTLGLSALGLPDLQCHYKNLEPSSIASLLYNYGHYIFDNEDVIEDGNTIQGISPKEQWTCQHEMSLIKPSRMVIDIDPGNEYAGGDR